MYYMKEFKKAGEPSNCIPDYLIEQCYKSLPIWRYKTLEEMKTRLTKQIEGIDRLEFTAWDNGKVIAMMVIDELPEETHTGYPMLYTMLSFSTVKGALSEGYKWLFKIAKSMGYRFVNVTRQIGPMEINNKIRELH